MKTQPAKPVVARGLGPRGLRIGLAVAAAVYFLMLLVHPAAHGIIRPIAYFTECTGLFTTADLAATEYRLNGWSCAHNAWEPLDPRPYFPLRADDKEARFQRLGHFYRGQTKVFQALRDYVLERHAHTDDGLPGPIGGIQMYQLQRPIPPPGSAVDRYEYQPLAPPPADAQRELVYESSPKSLRDRCAGTAPAAVGDPWSTP